MGDLALPSWFSGTADVLSVFGFIITGWVGWQARTLKEYFFNRVRIGEILPEISKDSEELLKAIREWEDSTGDAQRVHLAISQIKGRLNNLKGKLKSDEKRSLTIVLAKVERRRFYFFPGKVSEISLADAWDIARDLNSMIVQVESGHKDSNWRQR
ncbi:hypothetical protein ABE525_03125 [Pseudomonas wadenswilerensis]|uniref:hypothetical protein n=1 Tax=Pseudomonas wadenswilerensis TaxID=1785161 RepID=UPI0032090D1B